MQEPSLIEKYWNNIAAKVGDDRKYHDLNPNEQAALVQSVNILLMIISRQIPANNMFNV